MTLTRHRTFQYVGILLALVAIAAGYWYFAARAGVKTNSGAAQPQGIGDLSAGLRAYWKLDENTGTSAADSSTNAIASGTLTNGPTWTTGQIGSAVNLDGTNDYVTIADSAPADVTGSHTLSVWVKWDALPTGGDADYVLEKSSGSTTSNYYLYYQEGQGVTCGFAYSDGNFINHIYSVPPTVSTWTHYTCVFNDASNTYQVYQNGALVLSESETNTPQTDSGAINFGRSSAWSTYYLDGQMDEVRIYDRPLLADEVASLYRLTTPTSVDTSLKGYWSFNGQDLSGTTAYDRSGVGNHGTLTNGPAVIEGRVGQALSFDNVNDYVLASSPAAVDDLETQGGGGMTASAWIYPESGGTYGGNIVGKSVANGPGSGDWAFTIHEGGNAIKFFKTFSTTTLEAKSLPGSIVLNKWQFVTVTWNGSATRSSVVFYVDGVLVPTSTTTGADGVGTKDSDAARVVGISDGGYMFDGLIDEVRLHNRILSAAEIKALYDRGAADKTNTSAGQAQGTGNLDSGLAGYWKLDENTGTSAADSSTNGATGTLTNGPTWTTGQIGSAVSFDGSNDYVSVASAPNVSNKSFTFSIWAKHTTTGANNWMLGQGSGTSGNGFVFGFKSDDKVRCTFFGVGYDLDTSNTYTDSNWHLWACSYDAISNTASIYQDGVFLVSGSMPGDYGGSGALKIGALFDNSAPFQGQLDEVRIYDRVLSSDEMANLYRLTTPTSVDTGLKGYWSFDGSALSGTTAHDRSGAGNAGTLTNGPTVKWGRVGQALTFDGTNDTVDSDSSNGLAVTTTYTLSAWVNPATVAAGYRTFLNKGSGSNTNFYFEMNGDEWSSGFHDGSSWHEHETTTFNAVTGQWYHVVATYNGSLYRIYVNGVEVLSEAETGTPVTTNDDFNLGSNTDATNFWQGGLDEVRVYSRVLSAAEIKAQYDAAAPDKTNTSVSTPQGTGRLDSGLVGYWKLDENTGTSAGDTSTNGNTGTLTNGPTWGTGRIGSAVDFDGANDTIEVTSVGQTDNLAAVTVCAWVNPDATLPDGYATLVKKGNVSVYWDFYLQDVTGSTHGLGTSLNGSGYQFDSSTLGVPIGSWSHICGVQPAGVNSDGFRLYINGSETGKTSSDGGSSTRPTDTGELIRIGADTSAAYRYAGLIDEVRVYDRALSADEISQLYQQSTPTGVDTGLKGYWSFNGQDMAGTTAYDRSGSGNDGTLTNGPVAKWGKLGQALQFDGSNDYLDVGSAASFDNITNLTACSWVNLETMPDAVAGIYSKQEWEVQLRGTVPPEVGFFRNFSTTLGSWETTQTVPVGEWTHICVTYNDSSVANDPIIYINGISSPVTETNTPVGTRTTDATEVLILGDYDGAGSDNFDGSLDEARVYNRILSASEIKALYSSGR